eukprot:762138-Hanusia_phi.AAC.3
MKRKRSTKCDRMLFWDSVELNEARYNRQYLPKERSCTSLKIRFPFGCLALQRSAWNVQMHCDRFHTTLKRLNGSLKLWHECTHYAV